MNMALWNDPKLHSNGRKDMDKPRRVNPSSAIFNPIHQVLHRSTTTPFEHTQGPHKNQCFGQSIHMENIHPNGFGCFSQRARPPGFSGDSQSRVLRWETLKCFPKSGILISPTKQKTTINKNSHILYILGFPLDL